VISLLLIHDVIFNINGTIFISHL